MKNVIYFLGMVLAMCCCSSKEDKASVAASEGATDNVTHLYTYYDFRKENPGCEIEGFSGSDDFGRWSNGDTATVELMAAPMAEITLRLDVDRVITPRDIPFVFDVEVNGAKIAHLSTNALSTVYVNVPKENIGADGSARVKFIFENAAQPSKYNPENTDGRKLGFALSGITLYGYSLK